MALVLIVDDVKSEAELMSKVVVSMGHRVEVASNGEEALSKAKAGRPALVLLDVVMPKQDGFATCRKLKKDPDTEAIPVVLVTSKNQDTDKFWGEKQGCDAYVTKPFTPDQLSDVVRKFVG
jgi:twitching motility two-component system response regulator PilH